VWCSWWLCQPRNTRKFSKAVRATGGERREKKAAEAFNFSFYSSTSFASNETYEQNDSLNPGALNANVIAAAKNYNLPAVRKNDLNAGPAAPENENAILRMEVELRDKHQKPRKAGKQKAKQFAAMDLNVGTGHGVDVSMEKVRSAVLALKPLSLIPALPMTDSRGFARQAGSRACRVVSRQSRKLPSSNISGAIRRALRDDAALPGRTRHRQEVQLVGEVSRVDAEIKYGKKWQKNPCQSQDGELSCKLKSDE
jgi:hypothetical protein